MRLSVLNFLLLTTIAIASSEERHKRHLPMLMKLIKTALFGPEDTIVEEAAVSQPRPEYEVFRIPGHNDVVVKVSPKVLNAEGVVYREVEPVNLRAFGSVIGIGSPDDTIAAVREVDNLLSTGILYGGYDDVMRDHIVAMFPGIRTVGEENFPVIEPRPVISEVITPLEEAEMEVPLDTDSYEKLNNQEKATIITADTKPGTELVKTIKNNELPDYIRKRIDAADLLGADPYKYERIEEVYPAPEVSVAKPIHLDEVQVSSSKDDSNSENKELTAFTNTGKEVNISETFGPIPSGYLERMNYTASLKHDKLKSIIIVPTNETIAPKRVKSVDLPANSLKLLKSEVINLGPLYFHSSNPVHLEDVQVSVLKDTGNLENEDLSPYTSTGEKVDVSNTLGPIPYTYLKHIKDTNSLETNDQTKPVVIAPSKKHSPFQEVENNVGASRDSKTKVWNERDLEKADQIAISKENDRSSHFVTLKSTKSKNVHRKDDQVRVQIETTTSNPEADISDGKGQGHVYINHPNPIKVKLVQESDILKTNVKTNKDNSLEVVAPVKIELDKANAVQSKHSEQGEKVSEPKRFVDSRKSSINPLITNEVKSSEQNPVLTLNNVRNKEDAHQKYFKIAKPHVKTYSYQQKEADGSSINVEADKDVISEDFKGRGDIPEK